jgi:hypothetical protein
LQRLDVLVGHGANGSSTMIHAPSDPPRFFWRKFKRSSIDVGAVANAASAVLGLDDNRPSSCPRGYSNNCRLRSMFVTGTVSFFDITAAPPSYGAGRLNSAIPMSGFADRI